MFNRQRKGMVIRTEDISFNFGNQQILTALSLRVPEGSIYGFLGPNGAGKTTTIKLLLNLLKTSRGSIHIFEKDIKKHRIGILSQIGSLIEQPAIYAHLSGRENLRNRALLLNVSRNRVEDMLTLVQLQDAASKKAGNYSLGMKQRLGIALALLTDPRLLILDEPTNGLDPNGIIEVRELLIRLVKEQGKTVFVSSHLLAEVERMATHVGIINFGNLLFQGSIKDMEAISQPSIHIETNNNTEAASYLNNAGINITNVTDAAVTVPFVSREQMAELNRQLVQQSFTVYAIHKVQKDLEKLFLDITKKPLS